MPIGRLSLGIDGRNVGELVRLFQIPFCPPVPARSLSDRKLLAMRKKTVLSFMQIRLILYRTLDAPL